MDTENLHIQKNEFSSKSMIYMFLIPLIFFALVIIGYFLTIEIRSAYTLGISTSVEGGVEIE